MTSEAHVHHSSQTIGCLHGEADAHDSSVTMAMIQL